MNKDFRVNVDFFNHHKTKKLQKRLGLKGVICLLKLWAYTAKERSDGFLTGMTEEDIELAVDFKGKDGVFVKALLEIGFIHSIENIFALHDWIENNSWASASEERSDTARFSRLAKVSRQEYERLKDSGVTSINKEDYIKLTASSGRQTNVNDSLTPAPAPKDIKTGVYIAREENSVSEPGESDFLDFEASQDFEKMTEVEKKEYLQKTKAFNANLPNAEFIELREFYNIQGKEEPDKSGLAEYKKLEALRRKPHIQTIFKAIEAYKKFVWFDKDPRFIPSMATFLKEERWTKIPTKQETAANANANARASPQRPIAYTQAQKQQQDREDLADELTLLKQQRKARNAEQERDKREIGRNGAGLQAAIDAK